MKVVKKATGRPGRAPRRGQSFQAGRAFGFNLGHAFGFEAGYDKGYAEGSTLGYNNGFLQALQLLQGEEGIPGEKIGRAVLARLAAMAAEETLAITLSGAASPEAAGLFAFLGTAVRVAGESPPPG